MRGFNCYYFRLDAKKNIEWNNNTACWAGVKYWIHLPNNVIYIDDWKYSKTKKYAKTLVEIINKITPCDIVTIKKKQYIRFKLLKTYDQSLILLNFIRNLWDVHCGDSYIKLFFEYLAKSRYKDPLKRLTSANCKACLECKPDRYAGGHSNFHLKGLLVKDVASLLAYNGTSTSTFLTTK